MEIHKMSNRGEEMVFNNIEAERARKGLRNGLTSLRTARPGVCSGCST